MLYRCISGGGGINRRDPTSTCIYTWYAGESRYTKDHESVKILMNEDIFIQKQRKHNETIFFRQFLLI